MSNTDSKQLLTYRYHKYWVHH